MALPLRTPNQVLGSGDPLLLVDGARGRCNPAMWICSLTPQNNFLIVSGYARGPASSMRIPGCIEALEAVDPPLTSEQYLVVFGHLSGHVDNQTGFPSMPLPEGMDGHGPANEANGIHLMFG